MRDPELPHIDRETERRPKPIKIFVDSDTLKVQRQKVEATVPSFKKPDNLVITDQMEEKELTDVLDQILSASYEQTRITGYFLEREAILEEDENMGFSDDTVRVKPVRWSVLYRDDNKQKWVPIATKDLPEIVDSGGLRDQANREPYLFQDPNVVAFFESNDDQKEIDSLAADGLMRRIAAERLIERLEQKSKSPGGRPCAYTKDGALQKFLQHEQEYFAQRLKEELDSVEDLFQRLPVALNFIREVRSNPAMDFLPAELRAILHASIINPNDMLNQSDINKMLLLHLNEAEQIMEGWKKNGRVLALSGSLPALVSSYDPRISKYIEGKRNWWGSLRDDNFLAEFASSSDHSHNSFLELVKMVERILKTASKLREHWSRALEQQIQREQGDIYLLEVYWNAKITPSTPVWVLTSKGDLKLPDEDNRAEELRSPNFKGSDSDRSRLSRLERDHLRWILHKGECAVIKSVIGRAGKVSYSLVPEGYRPTNQQLAVLSKIADEENMELIDFGIVSDEDPKNMRERYIPLLWDALQRSRVLRVIPQQVLEKVVDLIAENNRDGEKWLFDGTAANSSCLKIIDDSGLLHTISVVLPELSEKESDLLFDYINRSIWWAKSLGHADYEPFEGADYREYIGEVIEEIPVVYDVTPMTLQLIVYQKNEQSIAYLKCRVVAKWISKGATATSKSGFTGAEIGKRSPDAEPRFEQMGLEPRIEHYRRLQIVEACLQRILASLPDSKKAKKLNASLNKTLMDISKWQTALDITSQADVKISSDDTEGMSKVVTRVKNHLKGSGKLKGIDAHLHMVDQAAVVYDEILKRIDQDDILELINLGLIVRDKFIEEIIDKVLDEIHAGHPVGILEVDQIIKNQLLQM